VTKRPNYFLFEAEKNIELHVIIRCMRGSKERSNRGFSSFNDTPGRFVMIDKILNAKNRKVSVQVLEFTQYDYKKKLNIPKIQSHS
jgi:hypothetical protein